MGINETQIIPVTLFTMVIGSTRSYRHREVNIEDGMSYVVTAPRIDRNTGAIYIDHSTMAASTIRMVPRLPVSAARRKETHMPRYTIDTARDSNDVNKIHHIVRDTVTNTLTAYPTRTAALEAIERREAIDRHMPVSVVGYGPVPPVK